MQEEIVSWKIELWRVTSKGSCFVIKVNKAHSRPAGDNERVTFLSGNFSP